MKDSSTKSSNLKALILAGGRGKRLKDKTNETNKCMLKFGHTHLIEYSLENAAKLQVKEIVIVVGYLAEQIINTFGNSYCGITDWVLNTAHDVAGKTCGCSTLQSIGTAYYGIYILDGSKLFWTLSSDAYNDSVPTGDNDTFTKQ